MPEFVGELSLARPSAPILGDRSEGDPPVPIPNTEVKPLSPDGTARASVWERRKLPGISHGPTERSGLCVFRPPVTNPSVDLTPILRSVGI